MLSSIKNVLEEHGRKLLALVLFGSYVYNPRSARDIDVIILVDKLEDLGDKIDLEARVSRGLRSLVTQNLDIHIFDIDSFSENLVVGTFLTGLVLGYRVVYDAIGVAEKIADFIRKMRKEEDYVFIKKRRWNLTTIAKTIFRE